jgi:hypothetical protein
MGDDDDAEEHNQKEQELFARPSSSPRACPCILYLCIDKRLVSGSWLYKV